MSALVVEGLSVGYRRDDGTVARVVASVDLALEAGEVLGLSGESGCGKSTMALAAIGFRAPGAVVLGGRSLLVDVDLVSLPHARLRSIWGRRVAYVSQDASRALNPALRVGAQLAEPLGRHLGLRGPRLREAQLELLEGVAFPEPEAILRRYPHQLSGGQQQRVAVALALACRPEVLVLDEPTTGLDVTTQARFCELLKGLVAETQVAALYVSHDLALMARVADRLAVMYAGEIVEEGPIAEVATAPRHPYARALLDAAPSTRASRRLVGLPGAPPHAAVDEGCAFAERCGHRVDVCASGTIALSPLGGGRAVRCIRVGELRFGERGEGSAVERRGADAVLLAGRGLSCVHRQGALSVAAVSDVDLQLREGETVGIVGESGSGKSTLLRAIAGLHPPSAGEVLLRGSALPAHAVRRSRAVRREIQLVFQNPDSSLNPRQSVLDLVARPIRMFREDVSRSGERAAVLELLDAVRLPRSVAARYPAELSGGQKQRVALARAFAARPSVLLCDEVTSALDVSVQAAIVQLIDDLAREFRTAVLFVSHDLGVVRAIASRALVMQGGRVCEEGQIDRIFDRPEHPYTAALLAAIPELPAA